jgi:hypothetical protein
MLKQQYMALIAVPKVQAVQLPPHALDQASWIISYHITTSSEDTGWLWKKDRSLILPPFSCSVATVPTSPGLIFYIGTPTEVPPSSPSLTMSPYTVKPFNSDADDTALVFNHVFKQLRIVTFFPVVHFDRSNRPKLKPKTPLKTDPAGYKGRRCCSRYRWSEDAPFAEEHVVRVRSVDSSCDSADRGC